MFRKILLLIFGVSAILSSVGICEGDLSIEIVSIEPEAPAVAESGQKLFESIFDLANEHLRSRNFDEAKKLFKYLSDNSSIKDLAFKGHRWAVYCEIKQGNMIAADEAFEALWKKHSREEVFINTVMGVCHPYIYDDQKKNPQKAVQIIDRLIISLPGHELMIRILKNKAEAYLSGEQGDKADAIIEKIIKNYPKHDELGATLNEIAFNCLERKDRERCERLYNKLLQLNCDETSNTLAHSGIAMCAIWKNDEATVESKIKLLLNKYKGNEKLSFSIFVIGMEYFRVAKDAERNRKQDKANEYYNKIINILNYCIYDNPDKGQASYACYWTANVSFKLAT